MSPPPAPALTQTALFSILVAQSLYWSVSPDSQGKDTALCGHDVSVPRGPSGHAGLASGELGLVYLWNHLIESVLWVGKDRIGLPSVQMGKLRP